MRIIVFAALLLASLSLCPLFALEQGQAPSVAQPQTGQPDQNPQQQRDQRTDHDQPKADDREMGRDWRMRRGDGVWAAKIAKWVPNGECVATAMMIGIATTIADDTETGEIETIEAGAARTETTGATMKIGPAVA